MGSNSIADKKRKSSKECNSIDKTQGQLGNDMLKQNHNQILFRILWLKIIEKAQYYLRAWHTLGARN